MCLDQFRTGGEKFFDSEKKNLTARNKFLFTFFFFFSYILRRVSLAQLFLVCAEFPRLYRRRNLSTVPFLVCFGESSKGKLMGGGGRRLKDANSGSTRCHHYIISCRLLWEPNVNDTKVRWVHWKIHERENQKSRKKQNKRESFFFFLFDWWTREARLR